MRPKRLPAAVLVALLAIVPVVAAAASLAQARGPVLLTVSGKISQRNQGDAAEFDAAMLDALPQASFSTSSPWRPPVSYSGPTLSAVLKAVGAGEGKTLRMVAADKYEVKVPSADAAKFGPLLARRIGGKELTAAELGPLLVIYPFDSKPELKSETYYGRSIWQLQRIVVE